jgi:hypothetical protein
LTSRAGTCPSIAWRSGNRRGDRGCRACGDAPSGRARHSDSHGTRLRAGDPPTRCSTLSQGPCKDRRWKRRKHRHSPPEGPSPAT